MADVGMALQMELSVLVSVCDVSLIATAVGVRCRSGESAAGYAMCQPKTPYASNWWNTGTRTSDTIHSKIYTDSFFCIKANYLKKESWFKKKMLNFKYIFSDCKERNSPWIEAIWSHLSKLDVSLMWICLCNGILSFDYWNLYDGNFLLYHHCYCQNTPIKWNL